MSSSLFYIVLFMMAGNAMADRMIRFTFNSGITPTPGLDECSAADILWIDPIFDLTKDLRSRRQLIDSELEDGEFAVNDHDHRKLWSAHCKDNCVGIARGTCRATGCVGYRRRERKLSSSRNETTVADQNHRQEYTPCDTQTAAMHWALDQLVYWNKVSEACKRYLTKKKRKTECYDDIIYGEILSFTFYNMRRGVLKYNVASGYSVCSNTPLNIEAVLNPCVKMVNFTMTGTNNFKYDRIDDNHPMLLFNTSVYGSTFGGRYLQPGSYQISARPDNFLHKEKLLDFKVVAC